MNLSSILNLGKQAITDTQPAGADVRDDDDFELLQNEMAKMSNPATSGTLDWEHVMSLSSLLLANKGKDILVACYLAGGLLQTQGLPGLQAGLQVVDDMLSTYWDTLYPPVQRMRGRRNALQWLLDRIRLHGEETDWSGLAPQEPALVDDLRARLLAIDALVAEKDSDAPSLRPAISQVNTIPVKEIAVAAEAPSSSSAEHPASAATSTAASTPLDSTEHIEQASAEALQRLADIAAAMAEGELTPQALRINRLAAWSAIDQLPPVHGGQTLLPGPIPPIQDALRNLLKNQANEDLIRFAEAQLPNFPFWLDLNCVAAQALERLGPEYEAARREVCGATAWLKTRLPGIEQLAFAGGMPFADADTQQWMQSLSGGAGPAGGSGGGQPDAVRTAFSKARAQAADNDLAGAAAGLQTAIEHSGSAAEKLQLRIHLCELLLEERPGASLDAFARAILSEIDKYSLGSWNPALALQGLQAAYRVLARNDELKTESETLLAHIIALDAAAAVKLVT